MPKHIEKLNSAINSILETPDIRQRLFDLGMDPLVESPSTFSARIQKDYEKFGAMIKAAQIKIE
jgi:tripartite-type tricarboxylate transporter receptor subunit TctC